MQQNELLNLFPTEADKTGHDILAMPDFFGTLCTKSEIIKQERSAGDILPSDFALNTGIVAGITDLGYAISDMDKYVADLPQEILDGLKNGVYRFGKSKKIPGNYAPSIYNNDGKLVTQVTLKKVRDPSRALSSVVTLSMQIALKEISSELRSIHDDVKYIIARNRMKDFKSKFFNARDKILQAANASPDKQDTLLHEADTYLMEGDNNLRGDIKIHIKKLAEVCGSTFSCFTTLFSSSNIDSTVSYIHENMQMIHRFVALRAYLFNYLGDATQTERVLNEYSAFLQDLNQPCHGSNLTAFGLIHANAPAHPQEPDFWLEWPKRTIAAIGRYKTLQEPEQKDKNVIFIGVKNEQ